MTTYNNSDVRILGDVELVGALSFEKNYTDFPTNPKPRTIVVKAGIAYIYTELVNGSGTWTWQPIGLKQTAYKHVQADPSTTWVVPHSFNSNDFAYFVYDENHNLVIANIEIIDSNTARIVLSQATAGMAIFFSIEYVGAQVLSATTSVNINGLVLTNGGGQLYVDGAPISGSGGVAQSYVDAADTALGARIDSVLSNTDATALNSLTEVVAAFQSADSTINGAITSLASTASSGLATETADRIAGDTAASTALTNAIATEVAARNAAISAAAVTAGPTVIKTVGISAATIQGCIDLCTDASAAKTYIVQIPSGRYTESLTLKGSVMLQAMGANTLDSTTVTITGNHTLTGSNVNPLNNRVTMGNIVFVGTSATVPVFTLTGTTATQVNFSGCYFQNNNVATTAGVLSIGAGATVYLRQCIVDMATPLAAGTNGGTQFKMVGGNLYLENVSTNGGTAIMNMTTAGYAQVVNSTMMCAGANAVSICANGSFLMGYSSLENQATTGNGINITGAGAGSIGAFCSTFNVLNAASTYVVTGVASTYFLQLNNNYVNLPGLLTRNVKYKNLVTVLTYASAMTSSA